MKPCKVNGEREGMGSEHDGLTVAELKDMLRERGLPVSGNKGVLLERLAGQGATSKQPATVEVSASTSVKDDVEAEEKIHFNCRVCSALLAVPISHRGVVECPSCKARQPVGAPPTEKMLRLPFDITQNQVALTFSVAGLVLGILAIFVFMSAFTMDAVSYSTTGAMLSRLFYSCCLMVPIAYMLTQAGVNLRQPSLELTSDADARSSGSSSEESVSDDGPLMATEAQFSDSAFVEFFQSVAKWFGVGLQSLAVILSIFVVVLVLVLLWVLFTADGFFA